MRLLIFGTGLYYKNRKQAFINDEIIAFVDNDESKRKKTLDGCPIISPLEINSMEYDYICLMAKGEFVEQMRLQLEQLRVPYERIVDFFEFGMINNGAKLSFYYGKKCTFSGIKKVLLLSHELSYSGAPLVLFYVARILRKRGYSVTVLSLKDGELRMDFINEGVIVGIQEDNRRFDPFLNEWMQQFDLVWGNTVTYYYWISTFNRSGKPFIWWLHESFEAYEWLGAERMPKKVEKNINIYAVGKLALAAARKYIPDANMKSLLYGAPDFCSDVNTIKPRENEGKVIFGIIGTLCPRKAQDIFLDAIELLAKEERKKAEFWIIGNVLNESYFDAIKTRMELIEEIKILGSFNRQEMRQIYSDLDVIVCPSREDPMPVVVTEAMIMSKPSIVSDMTGTVSLIEEKVNGLVCKNEDPLDLAEKMRWVLNNQKCLTEIGKNARLLYEENFSMDIFEKNINIIVNRALNLTQND